MKAFISYSHKDASMLDVLHKHLAQLQREGLVSAWTDNEIPAGGKVDAVIAKELASSELFIALVSPDYIASGYCYDIEFEKALKLQESGSIIILPVIIEPCDWLSTPFKEFKALPKDGKAISIWENKNTAFLDVAQNIRRVVQGQQNQERPLSQIAISPSRNYRVQKDFDSIEKLEFTEKTFKEVKSLLVRYIDEVTQLENIKARVLNETERRFECMLVNRNKIATESQLTVTTDNDIQSFRSIDNQIQYSITNSKRSGGKHFGLAFDSYRLFWREQNIMMYSGSMDKHELDAQKIAETIWNEWLESVGII